MELGIRGKTALVTASSSGIGKQCALMLAGEGARVVMCARGADRLESAAAEVAAVGGADQVLAVPTDLSKSDQIAALCRQARDRFGGADILIFIGGSPKRVGFEALTEADLQDAFEITVMAAFRLLKDVLPGMKERKWGRVVTVQSRAVREPIQDLVTSVATRPGVAGLFKYLANEAAPYGVNINTIVPGRIDTDRFQQGVNREQEGAGQYLAGKISGIPVGRLGYAHEIASAACFLASERASYITGAALQVDGGVIRAI
ncbi:MAG: SDR family oxidoreductase [Pseudomonadota bacterium]